MKKKIVVIFTSFVFTTVITSYALAVSLSILPAESNAILGDTVTLDFYIDGLGEYAPDSLGAFDVDISYDPSTLAFLGHNSGGFLGDIFLGEAIDFSLGDFGGVINISETSLLETDSSSSIFDIPPFLDDLQPASFLLASLDFEVTNLSEGSSTTVAIDTVYALSDGFGDALTVDETNNAIISNNPVPEPSTALLFAAGFAGLAGIARKKK